MKHIDFTDTVTNRLEDMIRRDTVLVVDSSMELVNSVRRLKATNLILKGKGYELLSREDSEFGAKHSALFGNPLAVALNRYVPKRKMEISADSLVSKKMILNRDGYICSYCGRFGNTVDHIVPKSQGGLSSWGNLTTACKECNGKKGDMSLAEIGYSAPRIPKAYTPRKNLELQEALYRRLAEVSY